MKRVLTRRGLDPATRRRLSRDQQILLVLAAVCLATAAAVMTAWLLGVVFNGAISA